MIREKLKFAQGVSKYNIKVETVLTRLVIRLVPKNLDIKKIK